MRKLLNTLYVTNPDVYLSKEGETIVARIKGTEVMQIPIINLEGIVCFNRMGVSPQLMQLCATNKIGLCFLSPNGRFQARVIGPVCGNVLLRRKQYHLADDSTKSLALSRLMIAGKIHNCRKAIERLKRDHPERGGNDMVANASTILNRIKERCLRAENIDILRGMEGEAASVYFSVFGCMILVNDDAFQFGGRNRRPPKDRVNCILSFLYTLLAHEVQSALETVGLDPYVGFLHTERPGRPSLALDLMEELRSYLCDRLAISLINRKQIKANDFLENSDINIIMKDNAKRTIIDAWQHRKKEEIEHPFLKERIPIGLLPYSQAMLLARHFRGDIDNYPVFLIP